MRLECEGSLGRTLSAMLSDISYVNVRLISTVTVPVSTAEIFIVEGVLQNILLNNMQYI
jgi:hypothetical protein